MVSFIWSIDEDGPTITEYALKYCRINFRDQDLFFNFKSSHKSVQVLYPTPDQSKSGSASHMTRSDNHRRHSVFI